MKKLLSLLIVLAVMLGTCIMGIGSAALAVETSPESDFIAFDGVLEEYIGPGGVVVVPSTIEGEPIYEIAAYAFANNSDIEEVWICEGIEVIGYRAFYQCPNLYKIELPYSVTSAGSQAFAHNALESITIPGQLEILEYGLCGTNPFSEVTISYGVKEVLTSTFNGGAEPFDIVFPESVEIVCGFSMAFPQGNGSRRITICNPDCLTGVTVQLPQPNLNHEWDPVDNVPIGYSAVDSGQVTTYIVPEGSAVGKICEKFQAYVETTKGSSCDVSGNKQKVQYQPQSYFDALPGNQKTAGITATRADLTAAAAPSGGNNQGTTNTPSDNNNQGTTNTPSDNNNQGTTNTPSDNNNQGTTNTPSDNNNQGTTNTPSDNNNQGTTNTPSDNNNQGTTNTPSDNNETNTPSDNNQTTGNNQTGGTTTTIIQDDGGSDNLGLILGIAGGVFLLIIIGVVVFLVIFLNKKPKAAAPAVATVEDVAEEATEEAAEEVEETEAEAEDAE